VTPRGRAASAARPLACQSLALGERPIDAGGLSPLFDPPQDDSVISLSTGYLHPSLSPTQSLGAAASSIRAARFIPPQPPAPYLRLTFAAARDIAALREGVLRLCAAVPALAR
jgi:hypothetical protein